jgi:putative FmdB family regulatory protein
MPTYAYRCQSCGVEFERVQKFSDKPLTRCPECRTGKVRRVPQPSAIVFKGSGWYVTDHKSNPSTSVLPKKQGKAEGGESSAPTESAASEAAPAKDKDKDKKEK